MSSSAKRRNNHCAACRSRPPCCRSCPKPSRGRCSRACDPLDAASKRLNRFLDDCGIVDPRKVIHSLRHRAQDRLRAAGCPEDIRWAMLGHEEETVAAGYGGASLCRCSASGSTRSAFDSLTRQAELPELAHQTAIPPERIEELLGTPDRLQAEILALPRIAEHKAKLLEARPRLETTWQHRYEQDREHVGADGQRIIATGCELIHLDSPMARPHS